MAATNALALAANAQQELAAQLRGLWEPGEDGAVPSHEEFTERAVALAGFPRCVAAQSDALCVKPAGHPGRCVKRFTSLEARGRRLAAEKLAYDTAAAAQAAAAAASATEGAEGEEEEDEQGDGQQGEQQNEQRGRGQQGQQGLPAGVPLHAQLGLLLAEMQRVNGRLDTLEAGTAAGRGQQPAGGPAQQAAEQAAAAEAMLRELGGAAGQQHPLVPNPGGITNATAGAVPGLNDLASRLLHASGTMPLGTAVPVPLAGFGARGAAAAPGAAAAGEAGVLVPVFPALPEHYCDSSRYSSGGRQQQLQFVTDPLTGQASVVAAASAVGGLGSKVQKGPEALLKCLPGPVQYIMADGQLHQALSEGGFTLRGYAAFREQMLRLAERVDLAAPGGADWLLFLQLDRKLRTIQHRDRVAWDHQGGCIDSMEVTAFVSSIAARAAVRKPALGAPAPGPRMPKPFRPVPGGPATAGPQPNKSSDCMQFFHAGRCSYGAACKYAATHRCSQCGSTSHGTAQHSTTAA